MQSLIAQDAVARQLLLTDRQVSRMVRRNEIPYVRLPGGQIRFNPAELAGWIHTFSRPMAARGISQPVCTGPQPR